MQTFSQARRASETHQSNGAWPPLTLYLWDDVLRFRQHELFRADSFAGVAAAWRGGEGDPLQPGILDLAAAAALEVPAADGDDHGEEEVAPDEGQDEAAPADIVLDGEDT